MQCALVFVCEGDVRRPHMCSEERDTFTSGWGQTSPARGPWATKAKVGIDSPDAALNLPTRVFTISSLEITSPLYRICGPNDLARVTEDGN
jgi:hypothetical protein